MQLLFEVKRSKSKYFSFLLVMENFYELYDCCCMDTFTKSLSLEKEREKEQTHLYT